MGKQISTEIDGNESTWKPENSLRDERVAKSKILMVSHLAVTGKEMPSELIKIMVIDLDNYTVPQVEAALKRVRRECSFFSFKEVISRIDVGDKRPNAQEAWAMIPFSDSQTCVWTQEMIGAYGVVSELIDRKDYVAARMSFIETYEKLLNDAKTDNIPVKWSVSLGDDPSEREGALNKAVGSGLLSKEQAQKLLPSSYYEVGSSLSLGSSGDNLMLEDKSKRVPLSDVIDREVDLGEEGVATIADVMDSLSMSKKYTGGKVSEKPSDEEITEGLSLEEFDKWCLERRRALEKKTLTESHQ